MRSIDLRRLKWAGDILLGYIRPARKPLVSATFVVHSSENENSRPPIEVFNDIFVIAMFQVLNDGHIMYLSAQLGDASATVLQQHICLAFI